MDFSSEFIIYFLLSTIPLCFALLVLAPAWLQKQNRNMLRDIIKVCDDRLTQEITIQQLQDHSSYLEFDRDAYAASSKRMIATLVEQNYARPHRKMKRLLEELAWITETETELPVQEIQEVLDRLDKVLKTLSEHLSHDILMDEGLVASLQSIFQKPFANTELDVRINGYGDDREYPLAFKSMVAEACFLLLMEMAYSRTGSSISMNLRMEEEHIMINISDNDPSYSNIDLLLQPSDIWPSQFLFAQLIVKKFLGGKLTGPLNYHMGLNLQAIIPVPAEDEEERK